MLVLLIAAHTTALAADLHSALRAHTSGQNEHVVKLGPIEAWGNIHEAMMVPIPHSMDMPVVVPPHGRLRLGISVRDRYLGEALLPKIEPTRFRVTLDLTDGTSATVIDWTLDPRGNSTQRRWINLAADLSRFAGQSGTLRFQTEIAGHPTEPSKTLALWRRPRLYDPVAQRARPNLLLITIDALRADHLGAYGYERPTSPALDRLAAEGIRYANAFTNAPMTSPSLPQLFTSAYYPHSQSPTLLSALFADGMPLTRAIVRNPYLEYWLTLNARDAFDAISPGVWRADRMTDHALAWIDAHKDERWALYLHYLDAHTPYETPGPVATQFTDPAYRGPIGDRFRDPDGAEAGAYGAADQAQIIALYDGAIRYVDTHLGRLFDTLRARGLLDHTVVLVTADHGEELWDHGHFFHGRTLFDEMLHVPMILRLPEGRHAGRVVDDVVRTVDVVPTLVDALGLPTFSDFAGRSMLELVDEGTHAPRDVFARAANPRYAPRFALRTATHKLVHTITSGTDELYDLVSDPKETRDIAAAPEAAPVLADLRNRLATHRAPLGVHGFQLRAIAGPGPPIDVEVTVAPEEGRGLANPDRTGAAAPSTIELAPEGKQLRWRATVGQTPTGFRFERGVSPNVTADTGLIFAFTANGQRLPPTAIHVGPRAEAPPASPFTYTVTSTFWAINEQPPLLVTTPPTVAPPGPGEVAVFVWRASDPEPASITPHPVDPVQRERLRALGYVDE